MLDETAMNAVGKMLDFHALRHKLLAANIANAETPGYRSHDVVFQEALLDAIREGDAEGIASAQFNVTAGGAVDPEDQVAKMAKNSLMFETFSQIAGHRIRMMRHAITAK